MHQETEAEGDRTRQCTMALGMVCLSCVRTWWMYALTCDAIFCVCLSDGDDRSSAITSDICMPHACTLSAVHVQ